MGNSVALDFGTFYVEVAVMLGGAPEPVLASEYVALGMGTCYFVTVPREHFREFRGRELYRRIERDEVPVGFTGVKYDNFALEIQKEYSVLLEGCESTACVVRAVAFLWKHKSDSFHCYQAVQERPDGVMRVAPEDFSRIQFTGPVLYPYLLVSVRTGTSLYRVESPEQFKRVGGSSLGGSTFWALSKLLCPFTDPAQAVEEGLKGDNQQVDLLVADIYGPESDALGLASQLLACSCGKLAWADTELRPQDISKSLIVLLVLNLAQIAFMQAELEGVSTIVMSGNAVKKEETSRMVQFCMDYWSGGQAHPVFIENEAYLGCLGVLLRKGAHLSAEDLK